MLAYLQTLIKHQYQKGTFRHFQLILREESDETQFFIWVFLK